MAALIILVLPSALTAAIITLPVAPTLLLSKTISAPLSLPEEFIYPPVSSILAPIFSNALIWKSTGLGPHAQPPGSDT